jgi:hypothetical protein
MIEISGNCPACGHGSLVIHPAPLNAVPVWVRCCWPDCPRPTAAHEILSDRETEHIVDLGEEAFTLRHPLRERLDDTLLDCDIHARLSAGGRPASTGRYRVRLNTIEEPDGVLMTFESLGDPQ